MFQISFPVVVFSSSVQSPKESALLKALKELEAKWNKPLRMETVDQPPAAQPGAMAPPQAASQSSLACDENWQGVVQVFNEIFNNEKAALMGVDNLTLERLALNVQEIFPQIPRAELCGLGNLMLQILVNIVEPVHKIGHEKVTENLLKEEGLTSPMMTVVLDLDWYEVKESLWPFFHLMAVWQLRNRYVDEGKMPPLHPLDAELLNNKENPMAVVLETLHGMITEKLSKGDLDGLAVEAQDLLNYFKENKIDMAKENLFIFVNTFVCVSLHSSLDRANRMGILREIQKAMKENMHSVNELVYLSYSILPFWSLLALSLSKI